MAKKVLISPMFVCSYALLPCILDLESMGCRLTSVLCFLSSVLCLLSSALCPLSSVNWPLIPNVIVRKYLRLYKALYICRDTSTHVMSALQIHLFMQNKAKFKKVKLNVTSFITSDYDQMDTWSIRKNKAKTNPILANKTPERTQYKPKQTQFRRQKMLDNVNAIIPSVTGLSIRKRLSCSGNGLISQILMCRLDINLQ